MRTSSSYDRRTHTQKDKDSRRRSGGPRTPEGRERSSKNATRHGILSEKIIVLQGESMRAYRKLRRDYRLALRPVGLIEEDLVEDIVNAKWRIRRTMRVETAAIDGQMDEQTEYWQDECPTADSDTRIAYAVKTLVDESGDLQHLNRYETRFHRIYHRSMRFLLELQGKRRLDGLTIAVPAPAPGPEPEPAELNLPNELAALDAESDEVNLPNELPENDGEDIDEPAASAAFDSQSEHAVYMPRNRRHAPLLRRAGTAAAHTPPPLRAAAA